VLAKQVKKKLSKVDLTLTSWQMPWSLGLKLGMTLTQLESLASGKA